MIRFGPALEDFGYALDARLDRLARSWGRFLCRRGRHHWYQPGVAWRLILVLLNESFKDAPAPDPREECYYCGIRKPEDLP